MAKWHYHNESDEKVGPIRGRDLKQLAQQGIITPQTRVEDKQGRTALARNVTDLPLYEAAPPKPLPPNPVPQSVPAPSLFKPQRGVIKPG